MKYRKPSRAASLLAFLSLLAQLYAAASAARAGRPEPAAVEVNVEAGVFSAGVIFGDLCARGGYEAALAGGGRPSQQ
jgi:hypothetical protein